MTNSYPEEQKKIDEMYMERALALAAKGRGTTTPNPMVGAVIVKDGRIIGEGYHIRAGEGHAEVNAFKNATEDVTGATMYVTLEPCSHYGKTPPCADKIVEKKIGRVVVGALDPNPLVAGRGIEKIRNAGIPVITGILAEKSVALNEVFMKYIVTKRPFVVLKAAMSLDGKIATAEGESQWISCEASREEVHRLRHELTGIMAGIGTVLTDDPMLNCRIPGGKQPIRIIVDSHLQIPENSKLVSSAKEYPLIVATVQNSDAVKKERLEACGAQIVEVPADPDGHVDLNILMERLGEMKIDSILLEGGGRLAEGALQAEIVDKVQFYIAPMLIGGKNAKTPVEGRGISALSKAWHISDWKAETIGNDIKIIGYIKEGR